MADIYLPAYLLSIYLTHLLNYLFTKYRHIHCVKSVRSRSFSGPYFPAFGLNSEIYPYSVRVQENTNFYAVIKSFKNTQQFENKLQNLAVLYTCAVYQRTNTN